MCVRYQHIAELCKCGINTRDKYLRVCILRCTEAKYTDGRCNADEVELACAAHLILRSCWMTSRMSISRTLLCPGRARLSRNRNGPFISAATSTVVDGARICAARSCSCPWLCIRWWWRPRELAPADLSTRNGGDGSALR